MARILDYYNREVESRPRTKAVVFAALFIVNVVFVGYLGIIRGALSFIEKTKLIPEYQQVTEGMEYNLDRISILATYVGREEGVSVLNNAITDDYEISQYLQEYVLAVNEAGFVVDKFEPKVADGASIIEITVQLSGEENNLIALFTSIENLSRLTSVKEVSYAKKESREGGFDGIQVQIVMEIYTL